MASYLFSYSYGSCHVALIIVFHFLQSMTCGVVYQACHLILHWGGVFHASPQPSVSQCRVTAVIMSVYILLTHLYTTSSVTLFTYVNIILALL